jgi:hypothetical protein
MPRDLTPLKPTDGIADATLETYPLYAGRTAERIHEAAVTRAHAEAVATGQTGQAVSRRTKGSGNDGVRFSLGQQSSVRLSGTPAVACAPPG